MHRHSASQWPCPRPALGHLSSLCSNKPESRFWWPWERCASPGCAIEPPCFFQAKFLPSLSCNIVTAYEWFGTQAVSGENNPSGVNPLTYTSAGHQQFTSSTGETKATRSKNSTSHSETPTCFYKGDQCFYFPFTEAGRKGCNYIPSVLKQVLYHWQSQHWYTDTWLLV